MNQQLSSTPARQGFYKAVLSDGSKVIAEWSSYEKSEKQWWQFTRTLPTEKRERVPLLNVTNFESVSKNEVTQHFACEPTKEALIEESYAQFSRLRKAYHSNPIAVTESRRLKIGDVVILGGLNRPTVVALHDNDEVVTLEYSSRELTKRGALDSSTPLKMYSTWHWFDIVKEGEFSSENLCKPSVYQDISFTSREVRSLLRHVLLDGVTDNPDYQRGYVWSDEDKQSYLKSLFDGRDLGRFMLIKNPYPENHVIFDGKQRLSTLADFFMSKLAYQGIFFHELSSHDRGALSRREVQLAQLDSVAFTREKLLSIFLDVNAGGVPQTPEHLAHVRHLLEMEQKQKESS